MKALSNQLEQANKTINTYGKDKTGNIDYQFNSYGFRSNLEYVRKPDILFAGGSISFGIGVDESHTYKSILSKSLGFSYWDISYAGTYNNVTIYETIKSYQEIYNDKIVIQWVSDSRTNSKYTVYDYVDDINNSFKKAIHIYIDKEKKNEIQKGFFELVSPIWIDYSANFTHPGIETHKGIAKYLQRKINES